MDRAEANAAKAVFDAAKLKAEQAGINIAKYKQLRLMLIDDSSAETDAERKAAINSDIKAME